MAGLPSGTLTFLFTDIQGSTHLWQAHPDAMATALARHDELVRHAIKANGGGVIKHTGDGLHAVFDDAAAALRAAVAAQRAVCAERWGDVGALRIRVALHSGTAQLRAGDYFGPTVNAAARVLGAGHGGQILATAATIGLVPGVTALDLGPHRLRDLGEPVRLFQVEAPGLACTFPPLRSLEQFRHNLPVQRSSFVGRDREIAQVRALLARGRHVTVTGVGGCGKTRLALAVAAEELDRFPNGVFFVDLSVLSDRSLVWNAVAEAVRIRGGGGETPGESLTAREAVLRYLRPASALLLLDNCEHLVEECAALVDALLDRCPSAVVLSTSREPLAVEGEHVFRVPSLTLPETHSDAASAESVRLFVDRTTAADASFVLNHETAGAVTEICHRLDGIPLAIELVASRVRHLSLAEIVRRLDDRFKLLSGGRRGARQRHQTLQAAIDWSHDLLSDVERTLLRRCAAFVGGFTLEAAEGVCSGDGLAREDVADALGALVDKSLVSLHAAAGRYRMLETIRLYAEDRLIEAGEVETVRHRHCDWFLCLGEQATTGRWWEACALPAAEFENFRAAQAWAHEMADGDRVARLNVVRFKSRLAVLSMAESFEEARRWGEIALGYDGLTPELRADVLAIASWREIGAGDLAQAAVRARMAIDVAPDPGARLVPVAYWAIATALMVSDLDAADRILDEGLEHLRRARDSMPVESMLSFKIDVALLRGELERALEIGRQMDERHDALLLRRIEVSFALHLLGRHAEAEDDARAWLARLGEEEPMYHAHLLLALTLAARGRWTEADGQLREAATIVLRDRYPLTLNDCVMVCGALAALAGDLSRASTLLACAVDRGALRSPAMFAVYRHYRSLVRAGLDSGTIRRCREAGQTLDLVQALHQELARRSAKAPRGD